MDLLIDAHVIIAYGRSKRSGEFALRIRRKPSGLFSAHAAEPRRSVLQCPVCGQSLLLSLCCTLLRGGARQFGARAKVNVCILERVRALS
jgi:hypothetical protein